MTKRDYIELFTAALLACAAYYNRTEARAEYETSIQYIASVETAVAESQQRPVAKPEGWR